jgi:neutral ceramidase
MQEHGEKQYSKARELFYSAVEELQGPVDYRHTYVDMPARTGLPGALGLSMFAGSTEDSDPGSGLREGIIEGNVSPSERAIQVGIAAGFPLASGGISCPTALDLEKRLVDGHLPKPITLVPGIATPDPLIPNILPLQVVRIGNLVLAGVPAELTTMAGRRLRKSIAEEIQNSGVSYVVLATYANGYSQYITTAEEYNKQHYEGASTLFGPATLTVYQQEFLKLASAVKRGVSVDAGPVPQDVSVYLNV